MKNANFMASLKAFFGKAWTATKAFSIKAGKWIVANKLISIPVAVVLVGGIACAIALPIALHEHDFATEWSTDANNHWHNATCSHEEEKADFGAHAYDNACDTTCNVCGATRTVGAHVYDNACDTTCNTCGATRMVGAHVYDNACDTACNACGATRVITHDHADTLTAGDTTHYYLCSVCGDKKDEVAHVFDKTVASSEYLKAVATATTKAQYYKSCVCGKASATEYFETDKAPANLQVSDISKTYDGAPVSEPTVTFDGVGAEAFAYYKGNEKLSGKPTDAGTYKVVVTVDETETHAGDRVEREFTIAKKTLSNLSFEFAYRGEVNFETDYLTESQGILAADVADGIFIFVQFDSKNVGAAVTATEIDYGENGDSYKNYEIDMATFTASIVPKVLSNLTAELTYDGTNSFEVTLGEVNGIVAGDVADGIKVCITFANKNVGAAVTGAGLDADDGDNYTNYELDLTTCTASIVKREIWVTDVQFIYDGYTRLCDDESVTGRTIHNAVSTADEYAMSGYFYFTFENSNAGSNIKNVELDGSVSSNYTINVSKCSASIIPRTINNLKYDFVYNASDYFQVELKNADHSNILADDSVTLEVVFASENVGAAVLTDGEMAPCFIDDNYVLGTYELAIVKKKLTNLVINATEAVYDVPGVDGSETATITLFEKDGIIPGETVEITVTNYSELDLWNGTFELCLKDYTDLTQGQEIIALVASGDYANYELVADANGVVGLLNIVTYSSFGTARVFECQADETDSFTLSAGDKVYLKVMGGENSKLNDFEIFAPTGSGATFTLAVYGVDNTTTPKYVEETALDYYYWDVCDTIDFYVELTCVTAGGINVSAAK